MPITEVREDVTLYDTFLVSSEVPSLDYHDGWMSSFAAMGRLNRIPFFNVRNRVHGLPYNNQDARDRNPHKLEIKKIHIHFFGPGGTLLNPFGEDFYPEMNTPGIFRCDLPNHCGAKFFVQKDERLATPAVLCSAGVGFVGGGATFGVAAAGAVAGLTSATSGVPRLKNAFPFADSITIPEGATFSLELEFPEWARELLQVMPGPGDMLVGKLGAGIEGPYVERRVPAYFGIQCALVGKRTIQQRGVAAA